ncbi:hypothetical protein AB0D49_32985 [Streptomyces sp. NPDC048290]|uniref:hypothetical protein n=1 Tax=Streptomyces sp. NPDC048290 TaxID=3155811 RepID=UPI00344952F9
MLDDVGQQLGGDASQAVDEVFQAPEAGMTAHDRPYEVDGLRGEGHGQLAR